MDKLRRIKNITIVAEDKIESIKIKNPLVTQTIEVMNQTEMLQTLIDTYANKSGFQNYLLNPCQVIPQVDFPPENTAELLSDDKFAKPLWFIPPIETDFVRGVPREYPQVTKEICRQALRKAVCGLLRVAGFNDSSNIALVTLTDAVDEFLKTLLTHVNDVRNNQGSEEMGLDVLTLEKGYFQMTQNSLMSIHNYFKNNIIARNKYEINEFKEIEAEYDKMMKESQREHEKFREDEFMHFLDTVAVTVSTVTVSANPPVIIGEDGLPQNVNIVNYIKTDEENGVDNQV
ncbi:uncharacterized protein LOC129619158 isoform X2 [Condylostylus longicornis]|nr:uncharacterized protein LOC129619158 isoform X2 [Condylostylus longicornis]